jgi:hypothetical protein
MPSAIQEIIGQTLSIIATVITVFSYQFRTKKTILFAQILSTACLAISYFLLGATSGFALNIVGIVRNLCFYFQPAKGNFRYYSGAFFAVAMAVVGILFWQGPADILIITALVINAVMLSAFSAQALRYSILFTCTLMTAYALIHVNIGAVLNESFSIVSSFVGILRYRQKSTEK